MSIRLKVGGFPYLAEASGRAGITQNIWNLPSCQSIYLTLARTKETAPTVESGQFEKARKNTEARDGQINRMSVFLTVLIFLNRRLRAHCSHC